MKTYARRCAVSFLCLSVLVFWGMGLARGETPVATSIRDQEPRLRLDTTLVFREAPAGAPQARAFWNWETLRALSQQGPGERLARLRERIAESQLREAEAESATRILAGVSLADVHEPVTDDLNRAYTRAQTQAGLRWELLNEARAFQRLDAHARLAMSESETALDGLQRQEELAGAYNASLRGQQREALADLFLKGRQRATARLLRRTREKVMLEAERLALLRLYDEVEEARLREQFAQKTALRQMAALTGQELAPRRLAAPVGLAAACWTPEALARNRATHPLLVRARQNVEWARTRLRQPRYGGVEIGARIAGAMTRDLGGSDGRDVMIGLDLSIPWEWKAQQNAQKAQDRERQAVAEEEYAQYLARFNLEFQNSREQWQMEEAAVQTRLRYFAAAQEALRVARLRLQVSEEGLTRLLAARHAFYLAGMEVLEALLRQDKAAATLWRYAPDCPLQEMTDDPARAVLAQFREALEIDEPKLLAKP